ncbi:hypothetical protein KGM_205929 [Danaus plexippus plexippus]|uniref:PDZ domain-containing protein n=1 Tax=Danaus plexippus plexippus TaxID=278856 RepID=A0A212FNV0_DANPL|nr:hypothetical protein KGM_205929 [Danaus plexippus plexippus]
MKKARPRSVVVCFNMSLYHSTVRDCGGSAVLVSAEARDNTWSAAIRGAAVAVEWSDHPALKQGDRVLEVNGTSTLWCGSEELRRALSAASPARLVLLRAPPPALTQSEAASLRSELGALQAAAEHAERAKQGLRQDNTRLTHRISYLEEQVAELLARHPQLQPVSSADSCITVNKTKRNVTNINITSEPATKQTPKSEVQVFQKGPDITAIVAKLPGLDGAESSNLPVVRPRSNASGASSRLATSPRTSPAPNRRAHSSHSLEHRAGRLRHSLSHHCIHDYSAETDAAIRMIERNQRHMERQRIDTEKYNRTKREDRLRSDSDLDVQGKENTRNDIKKAAERIEQSIKKTNWAERKTLSIIEQLKRSQRMRKMKKNESSENIQVEKERHHSYSRIDGKVLENAHKSSRRTAKGQSRSAKSSEFESECSDYPGGDVFSNSPRLAATDYDENSSRTTRYLKIDDLREDCKSRPTPPRKPLRLSLHKAKSAHSLVNGSESEASRPPSEAQNGDAASHCKRPVKRSHAADKHTRERLRDPRATPRPARRTGPAPPADRLYSDKW